MESIFGAKTGLVIDLDKIFLNSYEALLLGSTKQIDFNSDSLKSISFITFFKKGVIC